MLNLCESTAPTPYGDASHANIHYHSAQVTHLKLIVTLLRRRHSASCYPTGNDLLLPKACVIVPRLLTVLVEICHNNSQGQKAFSSDRFVGTGACEIALTFASDGFCQSILGDYMTEVLYLWHHKLTLAFLQSHPCLLKSYQHFF